MGTDDPSIQALISVLGPPKYTAGGEVRFNSPFVEKFSNPRPDRGHHLYINADKGCFFCFKSSTSGSLSYLLSLLGVEEGEKEDDRVPSLESLKETVKRLGGVNKFVLPTADLPEWYSRIIPGSRVHQYLSYRGVTDDDVEFYKIGEGTGQHEGWVIFPSLDSKGKCEYWVARNIDKKMYRNPTVDRRHHLCFLYNALSVSPKSVVICEGVFSAIVAGRDSVASLGKYVTKSQLHRLRNTGVEEVLIALDGDAWRDTLDTAERCIRMGFETKIVRLPIDQDPADMGREAFLVYKSNAVRVNTNTLIKARIT